MVLRTIRLRSASAHVPARRKYGAGTRQIQIKSVLIFQPAQNQRKATGYSSRTVEQTEKRQPVCPKRRKTGVHRRFEQTITIPSVESDANVAPSVRNEPAIAKASAQKYKSKNVVCVGKVTDHPRGRHFELRTGRD